MGEFPDSVRKPHRDHPDDSSVRGRTVSAISARQEPEVTPDGDPAGGVLEEEPRFSTWTGKTRGWMLRRLPPEKLLPEGQPSYVASWIYVFGMGAIASLVYIIVSGGLHHCLRPRAGLERALLVPRFRTGAFHQQHSFMALLT